MAHPRLPTGERIQRVHFRSACKSLAAIVAGIAVMMSLLAVTANLAFGSMGAALAHWRGENISISPRLVDVGSGAPGEFKEATVVVQNWTDQPIRIIGGTSDCSCSVRGDLPAMVPPRESRSITIGVRLPQEPGNFSRLAYLRIDDGRVTTVAFQITGRSSR